MDLDAAMTPRRLSGGAFGWDVPDGWQQGKGAFGGLVAGAMIASGEATLGDPALPLRAMTLEIMEPVAGDTRIDVELLRAGRSVTVVRAVLRRGADVCAHAVLTFGRDRGEPPWQSIDPPVLPPWDSIAPAAAPAPPAPIFTRQIEYRTVNGVPFSGRVEREVLGWVRPRSPGPSRGAGYIAACIDAYWPAALIGETSFRPAATLTFTLLIASDLAGVPADAPLAYRARAIASGGGYVPELRELWTADGRLVAVNPQTFALSR